MNPNEQTLLSESLYSEMLDRIASNNRSMFSGMSIGNEVENSMLLSWISQPTEAVSVEQFIDNHYPIIIEKYFAELRNQCFQYCYNRIQQFEVAEDIAQEVMIQLLTSKQVISNIRPWLMKVTLNLICKHYQDSSGEKELQSHFKIEQELISDLLSAASLNEISLAKIRQIPALSNSIEFNAMLKLLEFPSLKSYAEQMGIPYEQAKQKSKEIKRDFKALCLKHFGWQDSPDILDYNLLKSIQRYLRQLIQHPSSDSVTSIKKNSVLMKQSDLQEILSGFHKVDDWGIHCMGDNKFRLHIFSNDASSGPLCATIIIYINASNRIITESCKLNKLAACIPIPINVTIPKHKGKSALTFEQIKEFLTI